MRLRSTVQAVIIHVQGDSNGEFVPTRFEVNSWVTLMPGRQGGHARGAKKHGGNSVEGAYKGRILKFRLSPGSTIVSEVQVQHSYMHRQLTDLNPEDERHTSGANYLYPSEYVDWMDARSLLGIVTVVHAEVGEPFRQGRSHKQLLKESIFFSTHSIIRGLEMHDMDVLSQSLCQIFVIHCGLFQTWQPVKHLEQR